VLRDRDSLHRIYTDQRVRRKILLDVWEALKLVAYHYNVEIPDGTFVELYPDYAIVYADPILEVSHYGEYRVLDEVDAVRRSEDYWHTQATFSEEWLEKQITEAKGNQ
jgi:hypothetical protein